jgi:hypothetical protein
MYMSFPSSNFSSVLWTLGRGAAPHLAVPLAELCKHFNIGHRNVLELIYPAVQ